MTLSTANPESIIRSLPCWNGPVDLVPLKGGLSNASFTVRDRTGVYVARLGEDYPFHQVSREREAIASRAAFEAGLSPQVIHAGPGVLVIRHVDARTYTEADVRQNAARCIEIVKRCHREMGKRISGLATIFWVFQILRDYARTLKAGGHRIVGELPRLMDINDKLEAVQPPLPIIYGHHDLLPTNFLDDGKRLWLIDWEYGGFGTAMFDLANIAANNSFDEAGEKLLLETYFEGAPGEEIARGFHAMKAASALREALWGMVSELHLRVPGVDYAAHAAEFLERFGSAYRDFSEKFGQS
jgi:thiamine kinase-like enzyme